MGRLPWLRTLIACAVLGASGAASAAEITRVASSAEPDNPFDLHLSVRWDRVNRRAKVTQEAPSAPGDPNAVTVDGTELRYERSGNAVVPRIGIGLYHDLEIHAEWPYVLNDDHSWRYAFVNGVSTEGTSRIANNGIDANGDPCATVPCPTFDVPSANQLRTVHHGGTLGDLVVGVSWGVLSDKRDPTKPFWLVGIDVTTPTAEVFDPYAAPLFTGTGAGRAPVGRGIWKFDFQTALSRKFGPVEPYARAHYAIPAKSSKTYSNCNHAADFAAETPVAVNAMAVANCQSATWRDEAGAKPPTNLGFLFGAEFYAHDDPAENQKVTVDLRLGLEWYGQSRWYNELTDATRKLMWTDSYTELSALVGVHLRASRYFQLRAQASYGVTLAHLASGEPFSTRGNDPAAAGTVDQNPNFDFRYDLAGSRFRVSEATNFTTAVALDVTF